MASPLRGSISSWHITLKPINKFEKLICKLWKSFWTDLRVLTLKSPNKNCSRRHFIRLLLSFEENKTWYIVLSLTWSPYKNVHRINRLVNRGFWQVTHTRSVFLDLSFVFCELWIKDKYSLIYNTHPSNYWFYDPVMSLPMLDGGFLLMT